MSQLCLCFTTTQDGGCYLFFNLLKRAPLQAGLSDMKTRRSEDISKRFYALLSNTMAWQYGSRCQDA